MPQEADSMMELDVEGNLEGNTCKEKNGGGARAKGACDCEGVRKKGSFNEEHLGGQQSRCFL